MTDRQLACTPFLAELVGVSQAEVSKMERRMELYVGTPRKFIEAMIGELRVRPVISYGVP